MNIWRSYCIRLAERRGDPGYRFFVLAALGFLLILTALLSIGLGSVRISPARAAGALFSRDRSSLDYQILCFVRIPRTAAALLTGAALAVSGGILQSVLNNALAAPNILGINAGSGLFSILSSVLFTLPAVYMPIPAFLGALCTGLFVYRMAAKTGASRLSIVLAGIAVGSFLNAGIDTILILFPDAAPARINFMIGGFSGVSMSQISFAAVFILLGLTGALLLSYDLNILALGGETVFSLGMNVRFCRFFWIAVATLLAGSAVSIAGLIGFIGLIVPNASRFLAGSDNRFLLPVCALMGADFTLFCDLLARVAFSPFEVPVGIILSFLGAPFFFFLIFRRKRGTLP